jgi:hypothetical protein
VRGGKRESLPEEFQVSPKADGARACGDSPRGSERRYSPENATGFPICEMVMKQFRKLRVDIDDAFSVFRLGRLLDSFDDAAANVNHAVGKIEIIDAQSSGLANPHPGACQQRKEYTVLSLGCVDDLLYLSLREVPLSRARCLWELPFPTYPDLPPYHQLDNVDDVQN